MRALAVAGADLVVVPQAGSVGEWPDGLYEAEMRVAAFQNGYHVALCNRVGKEECLDFAGESFVCSAAGDDRRPRAARRRSRAARRHRPRRQCEVAPPASCSCGIGAPSCTAAWLSR